MPKLYDRIFAYANGGLLGEADSVSIEWQGSPVVIDTLAQDFAGCYPVPKHCIFSVDQFVPVDGQNFDPTEKWLATEIVTIKGQLGGSGKVFEADGFIDAPSITSSPTNPTKLTFKIICQAGAFK